MVSRGLFNTMEELVPYLKECLHPGTPEDEFARKGAEGAARRLIKIARSAEPSGLKRKRIEALIERWDAEYPRDGALLEGLLGS